MAPKIWGLVDDLDEGIAYSGAPARKYNQTSKRSKTLPLSKLHSICSCHGNCIMTAQKDHLNEVIICVGQH